MEQTNIADLKSHISEYLKSVQDGQVFEVCKRNVPIARIVPVAQRRPNQTVLGCGAGTVTAHSDITEPAMEWEMLNDGVL